MSETFACIRSSVMVKRRDTDRAYRLEIQSVFGGGLHVKVRESHGQSILTALTSNNLIFDCSVGRLHHQTLPIHGFTSASYGDVQIEELDLSF